MKILKIKIVKWKIKDKKQKKKIQNIQNENINEKNNDNGDSNDNEKNRNKNTSFKMNQSGRREIPGFGSGSATDSSDYTVPHIGNFYTCRNCFHFIF